MPYQNEFAKGDSLWRLTESPSVQDFKGIIRHNVSLKPHALPVQLKPPRGINNIKRVIAIGRFIGDAQSTKRLSRAEAALLHWAAIVIKLQAIRNSPRNYIPSPSEMRDMEHCDTLSTVLTFETS